MATAGLGSITAMPDIAGNRRFRSYLNQSQATTGRTPSPATLDQIIQSELDAMGRRVQEQQRFGLDLAKSEEAKRQFDISQQNALDTAKGGRESSLISTGLGAGATLMGFNILRGKPPLGDFISGGIDKLFGLGSATTPGAVNTGAGIMGKGIEGRGLISGGIPTGPTFTPNVTGLPGTAEGIQTIGTEFGPSYIHPPEVPYATPGPPIDIGKTLDALAIEGGEGSAIPQVIQGGSNALESATIPAATGPSIAASTALTGFEGMTPAAIDEAILTGGAEAGGVAAGSGFGLGSVALPLAAYQGSRFLGDKVGGTLGDILKNPITGLNSYGLRKLSDITGINEFGKLGKFAGDVEETLIQKPIDAVTGAVENVVNYFAGLF